MKLNNTFFSKFIPQENKFYPILRDMSNNLFDCSELLITLTKTADKEARKDVYKHIKALETKGDKIVATLFDELNNTFITPFDREDINALGEGLDDVLDSMNSAGKRVVMYQPTKLPVQSSELAVLLKNCCELIRKIVDDLDGMKKHPDVVKGICKEIHTLENLADDLYENFIIDIFENEKNSIELIKLKEIMQEIERATDKADSVSKTIKSIIVKYA
jgi:predicted phosphate transport protein (TIGR00153 family)